jgi:hypothetical protein
MQKPVRIQSRKKSEVRLLCVFEHSGAKPDFSHVKRLHFRRNCLPSENDGFAERRNFGTRFAFMRRDRRGGRLPG